MYDAAGRIVSLTQNLFQPADADPSHNSIASANTTWSVSYDAVGRITGFNAAGSPTSFGYDANGNRTASTKTLNGQTTSRNYTVAADSNRIQGFSQTAGGTTTNVAYSYNANGDLISDGLRTYTYNAEGRLSAVTTGATDASPTTRYAHNALGQRVFKTEPLYPPAEGDEADTGFMQSLVNFFTKMWGAAASDAEKQGYAFMYDEQGSLLAETGTGGATSAGSTQYIYLPTARGPMPIAAMINGQLYAVHSDHLNTPRRVTDSSGQVVWQWIYSAFGDEQPTTVSHRFASLSITPNPVVTSLSSLVFNLRWPGQYYDKESGLHYNNFRSYDPRGGFYTQNDPAGLKAGFNRRIYVGANPLNYSDPSGLFLPALAVPFIGGTGIGLADVGIGLSLGAAGYGLDRMLAKPPENAYDTNGPKAPGKPGEAEGFRDPKRGENWVPNPNGRGYGWQADDGGVWCPTGQAGTPGSGTSGPAHGGPHWDVQYPNGDGFNIYPGGKRRDR